MAVARPPMPRPTMMILIPEERGGAVSQGPVDVKTAIARDNP